VKKLSKVQNAVLHGLAKGRRMHYITGMIPRVFWSYDSGMENRTVKLSTVYVLEERGLVRREPSATSLGGTVVITEAGRTEARRVAP
jgi:hypothetical protein